MNSSLDQIVVTKAQLKYSAYKNKVKMLNNVKTFLAEHSKNLNKKAYMKMVVMIDKMEKDLKFFANNYDSFEYIWFANIDNYIVILIQLIN